MTHVLLLHSVAVFLCCEWAWNVARCHRGWAAMSGDLVNQYKSVVPLHAMLA
jgi:hypothetical protein